MRLRRLIVSLLFYHLERHGSRVMRGRRETATDGLQINALASPLPLTSRHMRGFFRRNFSNASASQLLVAATH
jgi:hypothetical protein